MSQTPLNIDDKTRTELEAAAFRRLLNHLRERPQVQNIDMMNLAGFCRNCLSNWLKDASDERGLGLGKEDLRTFVYGMPYDEWKAKNQSERQPRADGEVRPEPGRTGQARLASAAGGIFPHR